MKWKMKFSDPKLAGSWYNKLGLAASLTVCAMVVATAGAPAWADAQHRVSARKSSTLLGTKKGVTAHVKAKLSKETLKSKVKAPKNNLRVYRPYKILPPTFGNQSTARIAPSLALVETTFTAKMSVPAPSLDQGALSQLETTLASQVANGGISGDQGAIQDALVRAIDQDPTAYLKPTGDVQTTAVQAVEIGTGVIVAPNGYIVVSSQVVTPAKRIVRNAFDFEGLASLARQDASELAASASGTLNPAEISTLTDASSKYNAQYVTVGPVSSQTTVQLGNATTGIEGGRKGVLAKVVRTLDAKSTAPAGLTLLKISGTNNLDAAQLGSPPKDYLLNFTSNPKSKSSSRVAPPKVRQVLGYTKPSNYAEVGYNSNSDFASYASPSQVIRVSSVVSGIKSANAGVRNGYEFTSGLEPGSVGSVVVNKQFQVVGMITSPSTGQFASNLPNTSLVVDSSQIQKLIDYYKIENSGSTTNSLYANAFNFWFARQYSNALPVFESISSLSPADPYAKNYAALSNQLIDRGMDKTGVSVWGIIVIVLLALTALGCLIVPGEIGKRRSVIFQKLSLFVGLRRDYNTSKNPASTTTSRPGDFDQQSNRDESTEGLGDPEPLDPNSDRVSATVDT